MKWWDVYAWIWIEMDGVACGEQTLLIAAAFGTWSYQWLENSGSMIRVLSRQ